MGSSAEDMTAAVLLLVAPSPVDNSTEKFGVVLALDRGPPPAGAYSCCLDPLAGTVLTVLPDSN